MRDRLAINFVRTAFAVLATTGLLQAQDGAGERIVLDLIPGPNEAPVGFEAKRSDVTDIGSGYLVNGEVAMITPVRRLPLGQSSLFFAFEPGTKKIVRVRGRAWVPSPYEGPIVEIRKPAQAEFGMDFGRNLELEVPLQDDRTYFFFQFDAGFEVAIGATGDEADAKPLTLTLPAGVKTLFVVDPTDPFIYLSGGLLLPAGKSEAKPDAKPEANPSELITGGARAGLGFSIKGLIPFRPATTYGVAEKVREFTGNQIISGSFPLGKLPVTATGYMIGAVKSSDPLAISIGPLSKAGVNGIFDFSFPFLKVAKLGNLAQFGFRLGNATAAMEVANDAQYAYFSGVMAPDDSWIPDLVPMKPEAEAKAYAYVSSAGTDFQLHAEGRYAVDGATLGKMAGIDLGDIFVVTGAVHVDATEFRLAGTTEDSLGALGYEQSRRLELVIPFHSPEGRYLKIEGMNRFVTLRLEGRALIAHRLASVSGRLDTPDVDIQVEGVIETPPDGPSMASGSLTVGNPIRVAIGDAILAEAHRHRESFGSLYDDYRAASKDYEVELSLRGMKTAIPSVCDAVLNMLDAGERTAHARIDSRWPRAFGVALPGLSAAKRRASAEIDQHRARIRSLKSTVQRGGDEAVRAALRSAVNAVLANRVVRISISPVGTVYSQEVINDATVAKLRVVLAAIDALPAVSGRKARAEAAWNAAPKREDLLSTADKIVQQGIAVIPRIKSIGFRQPVFQSKLVLYVVLVHLGKESVYQVEFDAANPLSLGKAIGDLFAVTLR